MTERFTPWGQKPPRGEGAPQVPYGLAPSGAQASGSAHASGSTQPIAPAPSAPVPQPAATSLNAAGKDGLWNFGAPQPRPFGPQLPTQQLPTQHLPQEMANEVPARRKEKSRPTWTALVAVGVIASMVGAGLGVGVMNWRWNNARPAASISTATGGVAPVVSASADSPDWEAVAEAVGPAVVSITTSLSGGQGQAAGSGVIIDQEGHIITNDHVIDSAASMFVTLSDNRLYEAELVGTDEATDLAVIKIVNPPDNLTAAGLGESAGLVVGQPVAAIGNPLSLSSTMTTGIISALHRPVVTQKETSRQNAPTVTSAIQIDAAVNPGNSGGPVFDAQGRVIGIASAIKTTDVGMGGTGGSIGLGFAIPIDLVKNVSQQLIENGVAEHAYLGVATSEGPADVNGTMRRGAVIRTVQPDTPAAKAGIRVDDVIVRVNDLDVSSEFSLTGIIRGFSAGDVVTVTLERNGELLDVDVTLATRPDK